MIQLKSQDRSHRHILQEKTGSIGESLGGVALVMMAIATLATAIVTNTSAVSVTATKAERSAAIVALVGDKHATATWGTPSSPHTSSITLPNGHEVEVTTWREDAATSVQYTAVAPMSADADAASCATPADVAKPGCLYATRTHADDLELLRPEPLIRKDASAATSVVGKVDARVSTDATIPQGTTFAEGVDSTASAWRYLVDAHTTEANGEIRISQGTKTLAVFPVTQEGRNFYGTFTAQASAPVTATVTSGNVVVSTVFIYRAGSTS
ncbi:hypothetical protein OVA26_16085 [Microbacterium sp. SL62]|uniref:hypothetical protein n=1 Tax=Microbacterium sp. SL62 TaxID=2995139 RepID=UPI0022770810|nr:hypothetical protein [Microbacterium sp. SL62]MCY1718455.1 hypothetical protein [Microbacterium sp. SL62]